MAAAAPRLPRSVNVRTSPLPVLQRPHHKGSFARLATELGYGAPEAHEITSATALAQLREPSRFVLKPVYSRFATRTLVPGGQTHSGALVQVSRLGNPLVNEAIIDLARKDAFNGLEPAGDAAALDRVTDPEVPKLLKAIFNVDSPPAPRNDLVTIFLTGIPGLNQPVNVRAAEMLRLNMAIPPSANPSTMGVLGGDFAGFPNGRRVGDDVVDIVLQAAAGATPLTPAYNRAPNNQLGDGVNKNDVPYLTAFPYLGIPHAGNK